jgi:hypothetical protein
MSVWDESATLAGIKIGRAQFIEEPNEFGSGPARAATRYHQRFAGRPNNVRCPLHRGRVGKDNRVRLALEMLVELLFGSFLVQRLVSPPRDALRRSHF